MRPTTRIAVLLVGAVTLLGGALLFHDLSFPDRKYFDEVYYASDGCRFAGIPFEECGLDADTERSWVHPPLGKRIIAMGIDAFGNRPFGWRFAGAAAGTAVIAMVGMLAFLLWGKPIWAGVAALLAATESLLFVQARIAMLDIFLVFFVVAGFTLLVADRRWGQRPVWRPLRFLAGAAFGAAVAVKWAGLLALLGALALSVAWARTRARKEPSPLLAGIRREGFGVYLALMVTPLVAYLLAWVPWLAERGFDLGDLVRHHGEMLRFHLNLETVKAGGEPIHPYLSSAWTWLLMTRPVAYFWEGDPSCCSEVLGMGNPFLYWGGLLFVPYLGIRWWKGRDWRAGAILVPILSQYVPWLVLVMGRPLFFFYMAPIAPFLALCAAYAIRDVARIGRPRRTFVPVAAALVVVVVGLFAFFWPILSAFPISREAWQIRMWLPGWV